jgi:hypothetical protein
MFIDREMGQKSAHCIGVKFSRVALVMKQDVSLDSVTVSVFGAETEMPKSGHFGNLIEQLFSAHN